MKKAFLTACLCLMSVCSLFAQFNYDTPIFKGGQPQTYIRGYYSNYFYNQRYKDTACTCGITYLSFKVLNNGKLAGISCSVGTPEYLAKDLIASAKATEGLWDYKGTDSPYFLMPVIYFFQCFTKNTAPSYERRFFDLLNNISDVHQFNDSIPFQDRVKYRRETYFHSVMLTPMYIR